MKTLNMRNASRLALGLLLGLAGTAPALAGERVDITKEAPADGTVSIETMAGNVKVTGWDRAEIRVEGELDDRAERLDFERDGNFTRIKVVYPRRVKNIDGSDLSIMVPAASEVQVDTVAADVDFSKVSGDISAETVSGSINAEGSSREYSLASVSGSIRLKGTSDDARIDLASVSGDIRLSDANGILDAASVSGDLSVDNSTLRRASMANTSGDIEFRAKVVDDGDYEFASISGDVTLTFSSLPTGEFDLSTFSGDIDNDFGPEPRRTSRYTPGYELEFKQGEGEAQYTVETLSGTITLELRD
ncbi:MAG: DUF4097 family beta strand repeat-containing protein [Gammaproteobacteria bacterium]|nr:DUF4097 family beta strand repeat-containing protein [Gammaproteobacteria bacterium]